MIKQKFKMRAVVLVKLDDPRSNPGDVYNCYCLKNCVKRMKINEKEDGNGPFLKKAKPIL